MSNREEVNACKRICKWIISRNIPPLSAAFKKLICNLFYKFQKNADVLKCTEKALSSKLEI